MTRFWIALLACSTVLVAPVGAQNATDWIRRLDGEVRAEEVAGARAHEFAGGQLYLRRTGYILEVAIRTSPLAVASLCLAAGNEVRVLHASAALGAVTYTRRDSLYVTNESFDWRMREQAMDEATQSLRRDYFAQHGWVASTMRMGARGHVEMRIDLARLPAGPMRVALGLMNETGSVSGWPQESANACANTPLVSGSAPAALAFRTEPWPLIPAPSS